MKALIAYATTEGQAAHIADELRQNLAALGIEADTVDLEHRTPDVTAYETVVVAASVHLGKFQKEAGRFVDATVDRLNAMPSWFIGVSFAEATGDIPGGHDAAQATINGFLDEHGWRPSGSLSLAGAIKYRDYNVLKRMMMKKIVGQSGMATDTSRNWEYTDWSAVDRLAREIAEAVVPA